MRSDFEMLPFVALMLDDNFIFVEQSNEYTHKNHTEHRVTLGYLNGAWLTYQHQQSKVDELQKKIDAALKHIDDKCNEFCETHDMDKVALLEEIEEILKCGKT